MNDHCIQNPKGALEEGQQQALKNGAAPSACRPGSRKSLFGAQPQPQRLQERSPRTFAGPGQLSRHAANESRPQPVCCAPHMGRAAIRRTEVPIAPEYLCRPAPRHCWRWGGPAAPLRHQLTLQRTTRTGHRPRRRRPQRPSFQTGEAASSVTVELFQVRFSLRGEQRPRERRPWPWHRLVLRTHRPSWLGLGWCCRTSNKRAQRSLLRRT